jgi:hypothetical protein
MYLATWLLRRGYGGAPVPAAADLPAFWPPTSPPFGHAGGKSRPEHEEHEYDFERAPDGGDWDEYYNKEARRSKGGRPYVPQQGTKCRPWWRHSSLPWPAAADSPAAAHSGRAAGPLSRSGPRGRLQSGREARPKPPISPLSPPRCSSEARCCCC